MTSDSSTAASPAHVTHRSTARHGPLGNTPASYSGGPRFDPRRRQPAILTEVFRGFPPSLQANAGVVP
jgi:hypothetical protein